MKPRPAFLLAFMIGFLVYVAITVIGVNWFPPLSDLNILGFLLAFFGTRFWQNRAASSGPRGPQRGHQPDPAVHTHHEGGYTAKSSAMPSDLPPHPSRWVAGAALLGVVAACQYTIADRIWDYGYVYLMGVGFGVLDAQELVNSKDTPDKIQYEHQELSDILRSYIRIVWLNAAAFPVMVVTCIAVASLLVWYVAGVTLQIPGALELLETESETEYFGLLLFLSFLMFGSTMGAGRFMAKQISLRIVLVLQERRRGAR